jgi:hypothetical protein
LAHHDQNGSLKILQKIETVLVAFLGLVFTEFLDLLAKCRSFVDESSRVPGVASFFISQRWLGSAQGVSGGPRTQACPGKAGNPRK